MTTVPSIRALADLPSGIFVASGSSSNKNAVAAAQTMTGAVIGLGLLGYFLDRKLETAPALLMAGLILGLVVGFYDLWKAMFPPQDRK